MTRDERQSKSDNQFEVHNDNGILIACTGFGKTRVAINRCKKILAKNIIGFHIDIRVIVPTEYLKTQWEEHLYKLPYTYEVNIINGTVMFNSPVYSKIVIYDEVKKFINGNLFSNIFSLTNATYRLGLTPRLEKDEIDKCLQEYNLPIVDVITRDEARRNGWIADFKMINLITDFDTDSERNNYNYQNKLHDESFAIFGQNFQAARSSMNKIGASNYIKANNLQLPKIGSDIIMSHDEMVNYVSTKANIWNRAMIKRKALLDVSPTKLRITADICNTLQDRKIITFGQVTESCDILADKVPFSFAYHSNVEPKGVYESILQELGVSKKKGQPSLFETGDELVVLSKKKYLEYIITTFELPNRIDVIHTCKKLNLGADIGGIDTTITYARTTSKSDREQSEGRSLRKEEDKTSLLINVGIAKTKDISWLKSAQYMERDIITVNSVEELKEII